MTNKKKGAVALVMVFILLLAMFGFSSQGGAESTSLSRKATRIICHVIFTGFEDMTGYEQTFIVKELNYFVRKLAHFVIYMLIGLCSYYSVGVFLEKVRHKALFTCGICFVCAAADEIHQLFVPGRDAKISDVFIDLLGAVIGMIILRVLLIISEYIKNERTKVLKGR